MGILKSIRQYMDNSPTLKPYLLMWLRKTTKTINKWPEEKFIKGVMDCYERRMGYTFDLQNPKLFTEKLQWYKVYYKRDDFANVTCKHLFKLYVEERLGKGYTIPLIKVWDNIKDIEKDWDSLPEEFVLKANLQANGLNIKIIHKKSETDLKKLKKELKRWLKPWNTLVNSWDWHFYNGTPKILAEEYMANFEDQLFDYKFFCFNGEPYCIYVAQDHFGKDGSHISFYDLNWNKLDVKYGNNIVGDAEKPKHFDEMVEIARKLSKDFPFIRVDFFDTDEQVYVAELTFAPGGGATPYHPESFNKKLGDMFVLPKKEE